MNNWIPAAVRPQVSAIKPRTRSFFQPKFAVSEPGDPMELEADVMAEKVLRMEDPLPSRNGKNEISFFASRSGGRQQSSFFSGRPQWLQRQAAPGEQEEPVRPGETGDVVEAVLALPFVSHFLSQLGDEFLFSLGEAWEDETHLGKFSLLTAGVGLLGGLGLTYYAARNNPEALDMLTSPFNTVLPVPDIEAIPGPVKALALETNFERFSEDSAVRNYMIGLHFDVGRFLPSLLGFGPIHEWTPMGPPWSRQPDQR